MIKLEHTVIASPEQMEFIIEGMRNPMNSWDKSDSDYRCVFNNNDICEPDCTGYGNCSGVGDYRLGDNDILLMQKLSKAGTDHRKFMRMMPVYVRITAPLYWWKEFDTYKVGTVSNSCSTMHKITAKKFEYEDFSTDKLMVSGTEYIMKLIVHLNELRDTYLNYDTWNNNGFKKPSKKDIWWQLIQLLPSSYNQTRNVMMNYEVLANIYKSRKDHKLDEWRDFCKWIESLPYSELITGKETRILIWSCNDWLNRTFNDNGLRENYPFVRNAIHCNDGFFISIQASSGHYCKPRKTFEGPYTAVEVEFPSDRDELLLPYRKDDDKAVDIAYPYVPVEVIDKVIKKHGGIIYDVGE